MNYFIKTYGCQMNQSDSSIIEGLLNVAGMQRVEEMNRADLILVNTCSVRAHAEERAQGFVSALKKWKRERHGRVVSVVGCMAQRLGPELKKKFPWIDILVGPDNYQNIAGYVEETLKNGTGFADLELTNELYGGLRPSAYRGVSSYVPIMRGCDNYCSFCVVPYLRGRARSRDSNDILNEINLLVENGVKEVTLLGQNVNAYCTDGIDFADLLERINRVKDLLRIRFLTSHPADMSEKILTAVANLEKVCEYIHLPVQSASNRILNLMNRRYSREKYKEIVEVARRRILNLALSTDVIVGFPTETETDFEATKEFLTEIEFDFAYMFKYSPREETHAFQIEPRVDPATAQRRLNEIIELQNRIIKNKHAALIGKKVEVLVEDRSRDRRLMGRTRDNKVIVSEGQGKVGDLVWVLVERLAGWTPVGHVVEMVK